MEEKKVLYGKALNSKMPSKNTKMAAKALSNGSSSHGMNNEFDDASSKVSGPINLKSVVSSDNFKAEKQ
jgi:hypothetical protein